MRPTVSSFQVLLLAALLCSGCAWRSGLAEHYIGPVLFRYSSPPDGRAYVGQTLRLGISAEAGTSWGVSVGMSERIAIAPQVPAPESTGLANSIPRWLMPLSLSRAPPENEWNLSLLYLRVEHPPGNFFLSRTIYGAEIAVGREVNALAVGAIQRTLFTPPENAFSRLHFEIARPMEARAKVWFDDPEHGALPTDLLEEITK